MANPATSVALVPDGPVAKGGQLGGYSTWSWRADFDASGLAAGSYKLCADLDGLGTQAVAGDTGIRVKVSTSTRLSGGSRIVCYN